MAVITDDIALTELQIDFDRDGYAIARQLLAPDEVATIRDTFIDLAKDGPVKGISEIRHSSAAAFSPDDPLAKYPRMMHPHLHQELSVGPVSRRYILDSRLHEILQQLLRDEPLAVQSMFYFKPPGARGQDLHQDNFYLRVKPGTCVAAWIALDDADEGNGGMVCVPNTQNLDIACPEKSDPAKSFTTEHVEPPPGTAPVPVNLKAGDVMFFNGSVIHGSYPNTSKTRFRRSLIFHYVPLTTQELSHWYEKPLKFDGQVVQIAVATGGGPCGSLNDDGAVH
jgi:phytanoyl-CoA hydroxylase